MASSSEPADADDLAAFVLARCGGVEPPPLAAALRRTVAEHVPFAELTTCGIVVGETECRSCETPWPCRTLRLIGAAWADDPGYRADRWAP